MKKLTAFLLPLLAVAAPPSLAIAQPGDDEAPPAQSSEPPRGHLSQINGVPIQVGTHNEYYYDIKKWNVSSNPVGWMLGFYGVSASYAVSNHVALRGDLNYYSPDSHERGYEIGVGAPIYFRRTYQGVFLEPGLILREFWYTYSDGYDDDYRSTTVGPQVLVGWHWLWDSGLNVAVAVGAGRNISTCGGSCDDYYDDGNEPFVNGYLRFGYAF